MKNAIERAYETLAENPGRRVFMLSELIHNPFVNEDLLARGLRYLQTDKGEPYTTDGRHASEAPGVPLLSLVDLNDVWFRFDLREDLARNLKVGDTYSVRVPALGDQLVAVRVRTIAPRGEYAGWRATRATGGFDLRTFEVRAYPVDPLPTLRPGMSAYFDYKSAER